MASAGKKGGTDGRAQRAESAKSPDPKRIDLKSTPKNPKGSDLPPVDSVNFPPLGSPAVPLNNSEPAPPPGDSGRQEPRHRKFSTHNKTGKNRSASSHASDALRDELKKRAVVPVKMEPKIKAEKFDAAFAEELTAVAPALFAAIQEQLDEHDRSWFSVEVLAAPSNLWTKPCPDWPDLGRYDQEKLFLDKLSASARIGSEHLLRLEPIRAYKVDGLHRKKFYYRLQCTSEEGLQNIILDQANSDFKGYRIAFYQEKESILGVRFQVKLVNLPSPFKYYDTAMLSEVLVSQNWDPSAIEYIQIGTRLTPGEPKKFTGMLDIYIKPEAVLTHGCDFALENAGTPKERLAKAIQFPPPSVAFGRNPNPTVVPLLRQGLLIMPDALPSSGTSNLLEDRAGYQMSPNDFGKLFLRPVFKPGHCKYCWGPQHEAKFCLYNDHCRFCLVKLTTLPHEGFHHCCTSMIESTPKHDREENPSGSRKRPREQPTAPPPSGNLCAIPSTP